MSIMRTTLFLTVLLMPWVANAASDVYLLQVDGLACPFCAYGIEKKLSSIEGVETIEIDVKKGQIIMTMSEGATLTEEVVREKVKGAGFTLRSMTRVHWDE